MTSSQVEFDLAIVSSIHVHWSSTCSTEAMIVSMKTNCRVRYDLALRWGRSMAYIIRLKNYGLCKYLSPTTIVNLGVIVIRQIPTWIATTVHRKYSMRREKQVNITCSRYAEGTCQHGASLPRIRLSKARFVHVLHPVTIEIVS